MTRCYLGLLILFSSGLIAQNVGINTTDPRKKLEVAGDVEISGNLDVKTVSDLSNTDISIFMKQDSSNAIKALYINGASTTALAYLQEYEITNMDDDWIADLDTSIDATDYTMVAVSSYYNRNLAVTPNITDKFSIPFTATFIKDGTWHIIADYPSANNLVNAEIGQWVIRVLIFSNRLSKQLGDLELPMNNTSIGQAPYAILN